jgi:hypothetical protein
MNTKQVKRLQITAKVWSILSIAFILLIFIGEGLSENGQMPTAAEWVGLTFFPIGVAIGLILAWWREEIGGAVTVLSFIAFYIWNFVLSGDLADGLFFLLVAAPGFLFLASWYFSRNEGRVSHA